MGEVSEKHEESVSQQNFVENGHAIEILNPMRDVKHMYIYIYKDFPSEVFYGCLLYTSPSPRD